MPEILISAQDIKISYGLRTILNIDKLEIRDGDRIGLVGENGAGKTTLVRILSGELEPDQGIVRRFAPISVIRQMDLGSLPPPDDEKIAREFDAQPDRDGLSGGERTRRRIAGALSERGHVLLADEPTSDLDTAGVERLEYHLKRYEGAILLISHDRALLDAICNCIAELEDQRLTLYPGNFTAYRAERERKREFQRFEYDQYRSEQARLRGAIQGKKEHASQLGKLPTRMGNSEARLHRRSATEVEEKIHKTRKALQSRLEHLEQKDRPRDDPNIRMKLGAHTPVTSRMAVEIRGMSMRFDERVLLDNASMRIPVGTRTALMGPNGCGKTTLIKRIIRGNDPRVRVSPGVKIGFFGQDHADALDLSKSALENAMENSVHAESDVRTVLARLNLRGDDVFKKTHVLSGGERAKIALARLFVSDVNLLILDEPTNHLDIFTLESLQQLLSGYGGTLLLVSHDRRFIEAVATRLVFFEGTGLSAFEDDYGAWRRSLEVKKDERDVEIEIATLEMRMAALADRMSRPKKGDDPLVLNERYDALVREWRALKG